jgi:phosphotransferase system enzyme I (PtsI)
VLRLIELTVQAGYGGVIRVGMCGEMAADIGLTPLLLGMGLRELSVSSNQVARVKAAVRRLGAAECRELWEAVRDLTDPAAIRGMSLGVAESRYPDLFE